jgi:outer membrane lipoprotein-sorting protein
MATRPDLLAPFTRRRLLALLPAAGALVLAPEWAAALPAADGDDVRRVQDYLNGIHTLESRFEQVSGEGGIASGTIYLQRPGHMRIVYDPPVPILLVADQGKIWYYDKRLEQISWVDEEDTPAWFLLQNDLRLGGDITVTKLERNPGALRLTLVETKKPNLGQATLVLSDHPLELRKWQVVDAQGKVVNVTLDDPHYGVALNPSLFYWTDPRPTSGESR